MTVNEKITKAVLRDKKLGKILLKKCGLKDDEANINGLLYVKDIEEKLIETLLDEYLDFTLEYPHPTNPLAQVMNPIKIVGINGAYLVVEDYQEMRTKFSLFSDKNKATKYGNSAYKSFLELSKLKSKSKVLKPYRN